MKTDRLLYAAGLVLGALPLWLASHLPMVDLPQHLHLISVLHRLDDPTTLYPQWFEIRGELTPYLGYYYLVSAASWVLPLEVANRLFLTAVVAGLPLSLAFLLASLGRPTWPSLLALPFAYGDSFGWGFVNYLASLPLAFLTCGLFVRALTDVPRRRAWALGLAASLAGVLLFHVQAFAWLALALPWLLLTTGVPEDAEAKRLAPRRWALAGVVPGVLLFLAWLGLRLGEPAEIQAGAPWKAWGPLLSRENLAFKSFAQNRDELVGVLANLFRDGSDAWAVRAVGAVALAAWVAAAVTRAEPGAEGRVERWRMLGLAVLALGLFFLLPFDIRGYMYYLNTRFAHPAAALWVSSLPLTREAWRRPLLAAATACALVLAVLLGRGFLAFSREAAEWDVLAAAAAPRARVMGLVFDPRSEVVRLPVFLHEAAVVARARGGLANFSFASTPHSPVRYRGEPPPTFPSEWQPQAFDYATQGRAYDHFLVRGPAPARIFGARMGSELTVVARAGRGWLLRRR